MEKFITFLNGNPWLNLVFLALAVLSIVVSIISYLRSKKEKKPLYNMKHFDLVRGHLKKLDGVRISFHGEDVKDLTLTRLAFWNKGRDTIDKKDIAQADPLRVTVPRESRILEVNIDYVHNPVNDIKCVISDDRTSVFITFDYLHTLEGCVLTIYHTATGSQVEIKGTIKGAGKARNGVIEKDSMAYYILDATLGKIMPDKNNKAVRKIILIPLSFVFVPILIFIQPIEAVLRVMYRCPQQFTLEDSE